MSTPASKRTGKRIGIGARPPANPHAEAWIRQGDADAAAEATQRNWETLSLLIDRQELA